MVKLWNIFFFKMWNATLPWILMYDCLFIFVHKFFLISHALLIEWGRTLLFLVHASAVLLMKGDSHIFVLPIFGSFLCGPQEFYLLCIYLFIFKKIVSGISVNWEHKVLVWTEAVTVLYVTRHRSRVFCSSQPSFLFIFY